jgi:uncharacterized protein
MGMAFSGKLPDEVNPMNIYSLFPWNGDPEDDSVRPEPSSPTFENVLQERIQRRSLLKTFIAAPLAAAVSPAAEQNDIRFQPIRMGREDFINVPDGYGVSVVARWGTPVVPGAPEMDPRNQTPELQRQQFGYNCDYVGYAPLPDWRSKDARSGILAVNHEYTNPELMFFNFNVAQVTRAQVDIDIAAHGMSFIEVRQRNNQWEMVSNSPFNRRLTGETEMTITGPAAGDEWMRTSYDATGTRVRGTLNNCAGGRTPWGTVLTCEENFNQYFANRNGADTQAKRDTHARYGLSTAATGRRWENFHDRFDVAKEPNEAFRFGWVVEIDPYNPNDVPKKRTALGRTKHEAATFSVGRDNRVAIYSGDDEQFEYAYKFVTSRPWNPDNRAANLNLLDEGTLYAARYNADGSGQWLPLVCAHSLPLRGRCRGCHAYGPPGRL